MIQCNTISIDLSKSVFQICILTQTNKVIKNIKLSRAKFIEFMAQQHTATIVMEACYSSHYWGRRFLEEGHQVKLIPAQHVTPFVRGNKNDHNDALAIAEAARRPFIKFVPVKTLAQQEVQTLHRIRQRYVNNRVALSNQVRGLLADYGVVFPAGVKPFEKGLVELLDNRSLPDSIHHEMRTIWCEYQSIRQRIESINNKLSQIAKQSEECQRLLTVPGIGAHIATAVVSGVGNARGFANARELAVWTGLTPRQISSGHKSTLVGITKRGDQYIRKQLVQAARHTARWAKRHPETRLGHWINQVIARRGLQKGVVAVAHKLARIIWVLLTKQETFNPA